MSRRRPGHGAPAGHLALPFVADARYLVFRFLSVVPIAVTMVVLYLFPLRRRLLPPIVAHVAADAAAALVPVLVLHP